MNNLNELPEGWCIVSFGEIAQNISEYETKPLENGFDRCVGLEHIEPGSLHIKRWDSMSNEISFTRKFKKGQVLFGKRRAYQRKVAIAEFNGICSSDILVFEANKEKIIPELLPFIVQDDRFFDFAIRTSAGSLSPRTKWQSLSTYKILLPPYEEQCRISSILWAAEDCIMKNERFIEDAERAKQALMRELFNKGIGHDKFHLIHKIGEIPVDWKHKKLHEVAQIKGRIGWRGLKASEYVDDGPYLIANKHIIHNKIIWDLCDHLTEYRYNESPEIQLQNHDIVMSKDGTLGRVALIENLPNKATINSTMMLIRVNQEYLSPKYLYYFLQSEHFWNFLRGNSTGSAVPHIFQETMKKFPLPIPPISEQQQIAAILTRCDDTITAARTSLTVMKALKMKLINQFFPGVDN